MTTIPQSVSVDRIFLDLENPRHKPYASEAQAIAYLCKNDFVYALAQDMVRVGLNPLELFALIPLNNKKTGPSATYLVAEGNRRLCAIKLLNDPELAPTSLRDSFRLLAEQFQPLPNVLAIIFADKSQMKGWRTRLHGGVQAGIGRKPWDPDQKARHAGDRKNAFAQKVLDHAETLGFISPDERKRKLTTAQRYLEKQAMQDALGITTNDSEQLVQRRPTEDIHLMLKKFARDLVDRNITSRQNMPEIETYARDLTNLEGVSGKQTASATLKAPTAIRKRKSTPKEPAKPLNIKVEQDIETALSKIGSYKLQKLYFSICHLPLDKHTPLIAVGLWSFFETLTVRHGRDPANSFASYLSKDRLSRMGFEKDRPKVIVQAIERISASGNTTKHHDVSATFNGEQLANDMEILKEVILNLVKDIQP